METANPSRIRRCNREYEYAAVRDDAVIAARPDARPVGRDNFTIESFMDVAADAQIFVEEKFAIVSRVRRTEKAEAATMLGLGSDIPLAPRLPGARMVDSTRNLDRLMILKGTALDFNVSRNSVEAIG